MYIFIITVSKFKTDTKPGTDKPFRLKAPLAT